MRRSPARDTAPTVAERVRSILAAAHSMTVVCDGQQAEVRRLDGAGAMGHFHLHSLSEAAAVRTARHIPVRLELTDIAPTPVRDRLRARVTLTGLLAAPYDSEAKDSTCMEFGQAVLEDAEGRAYVSLQELQAAEVDPMATCESGMLTHLVDDHGELVALLIRLIRPVPESGLLRVLPVKIDRYGVTLRLEYPHTHRDARLPFKTPVNHIDHVGPQIHALLSAARRISHSGRRLLL